MDPQHDFGQAPQLRGGGLPGYMEAAFGPKEAGQVALQDDGFVQICGKQPLHGLLGLLRMYPRYKNSQRAQGSSSRGRRCTGCICIYMYICIYVCVHMYIYIYVYIYLSIYLLICLFICTYTYTHTYTYTRTFTYTYIYIYIDLYMYTCIHTSLSLYIYIHIYEIICV